MLESEIKIKLTEEQYKSIYRTIRDAEKLTKKQTNYYFETEDRYFQKNNMMLRIREKSNSYYVTFKKKLKHSAVGLEAFEHEFEISRDNALRYINGEAFPLDFIKKIDKDILEHDFQDLAETAEVIGNMTTFRTKFQLQNSSLYFELDKSTYFDIIDYEIECEYENDAEKLKALELLNKYGLNILDRAEAKYGRFTKRLNRRN